MLNILVYVLQSCRLKPHQSSLPNLFSQKKKIRISGRRWYSTCQEGRKRILLPLLSLKLCLCQVTTNRKSRIKTQAPCTPPTTQCRLCWCQLLLTNNHSARLLWHILPGGLNNRKAQLRKPAFDACSAGIPSRKYKGPSCPQTEERLPEMPFASSYMPVSL